MLRKMIVYIVKFPALAGNLYTLAS
jgi:hypothetical protein